MHIRETAASAEAPSATLERISSDYAQDQWHVRLLGGFCVEGAGQHITRFRTRAAGSLLAYAAYHLDHAHTRDALIEMLWPEAPLDTGRHNLSMALSFLRRLLEPPGSGRNTVIVADRAGVQLNPDVIGTDVVQFERALQAALQASGPDRQAHLQTALRYYRGPLLPGHFEDWVWLERARLADRFYFAAQQLLAALQMQGDAPAALALARRCVALDPHREAAHIQLMQLLVDTGQPAEAANQKHYMQKVLMDAGKIMHPVGRPPGVQTHAGKSESAPGERYL